MNKNNNLPKELPPDTETIQVDVIGSVTKRRFLGEFIVRIPTLEDQSSMGRLEASLNGESTSSGLIRMNRMISYLKYTVVEAPPTWRDANMGHRLRDPNVIEAVYDQVLAFEDRWLKQVWGEPGDENEQDSEAKD